MFQLKKREPLSLLPAPGAALEEAFDLCTGTLDKSFQGWLQRAATPEGKPGSPATRVRPMTTRERLQVERATVRESYEHCLWPKEAFARFLAAEVIRTR